MGVKWNSTGMTMAESRSLREATSRKLQNLIGEYNQLPMAA
ncbi:uncharacterized protein METZ01_LOCUS284531 [marine metagenome]|uniref:Uncharacterized protein n=1 Tax=marine metagenome TaxID=408172 RepID=A0A382L9B7_9ZZZZ